MATAAVTKARRREIVTDRRLAWSRKHDNRLAQNDETFGTKEVSFDESYDRIRTFSSLDLIQRFSASGSGEIAGIGGTVSSSTEARAHSELETEQYNKRKTERVIDTSAHLHYPGPVYRDDYRTRTDEQGNKYREIVGRTLVQEGPIWLIRCPIETIQTVTPITEWGIWDAKIVLNIEDWAGNYGIMPNGEHDNVLEFSGANELISFMQGDLVLRYKWLPQLRLTRESQQGLAWLKNRENRRVGPVEWEKVEVSDNVAALEPSIIDAAA